MSITGDILNESRNTYMNDPNAATYTDARMLPLVKSAYSYLQTALEENGIQSKNEEFVKTITAGIAEIIPLPVDLVIPVELQDRKASSVEEYRPLTFVSNIREVTAGTTLSKWTWRTDRILLLAATTDREIRLYYRKAFPALVDANSVVFGKAEQYLAAKTAALGLFFIGQSETLAKIADDIAENLLGQIINNQVKIKQAERKRAKPYLPFRRR